MNAVPSQPAGTSSAPVPLHAQVSGAGPVVVLLHGLFGMGSNLGSVARALAGEFEVHQLDLPNHGRSGWTDAMTLPAMAAAVRAYLAAHGSGPVRLLGHSLGGKVAMQLALASPELVDALVVADIAPVPYPASHGAVFAAINAVTEAAPQSRAAAAVILRANLEDEAVAQFLLLSLQRGEGGVYRWRFNAPGLETHYADLRAAPAGSPYAGSCLFLYGADSTYVTDAGMAAARELFPSARFASIPDTGHWLHAEKPDEFNAAVQAFLTAKGRAGA